MGRCSVSFVVCCLCLQVASEQVHFFLFWKTTSLELIPATQYIQTKVQSLIPTFLTHQLVNVSTGPDEFDSLDVTRNMYYKLNLTSFPSNKVLEREKKKPFYFVRSLVKESWRGCQAYYSVVQSEQRFRCSINDTLARYMCMKLKLISNNVLKIIQSTREQLITFFRVKNTTGLVPSTLETHMLSLLNDSTMEDAQEQQLNQTIVSEDDEDAFYDDVSHLTDTDDLSSNVSNRYRHRNKVAVALLYGLCRHMQDTEAALKYTLRELEKSREHDKDCTCNSRGKRRRA